VEGYGQFVGSYAGQGVRTEELAANPGRDAVVRVPELKLELPALSVPARFWIGIAGDPTLKSAAAMVAGNTAAAG
jgi:hypothetical protein